MVERISEEIIFKLSQKVKVNNREVIKYGFEIIISFIINGLSLVLISKILHIEKEAAIFLAYFVPIRMVAGGAHAESYGMCYLYTHLIYLGGCLYSIYTKYIPISILLSFASTIYVYENAPIENYKQRLSFEEKEANRKKSRILILIEQSLIILVY